MKTSTIVLVALAGFVLMSGSAHGASGGGATTKTLKTSAKPKKVQLTAAQKKDVKTKRRAM